MKLLFFDNTFFLFLGIMHAHSFKSFENTGKKEESRSHYLR